MKRLLEGGKARKPPDYEMCRWVGYCYLLNRPVLGVALFNLILPDHVVPSLYKQSERQARIMKLRLDEQGEAESQLNNAPVLTGDSDSQVIDMAPDGSITEEALPGVTARQRAMLKLQLGRLPLSPEELQWVRHDKQAEAAEVKPRTLQDVASFFGVTKERVRQINSRTLKKLNLCVDPSEI
jgi:DNA-directed RNA polymerase sigma subunit (sigma70/sigma32)